MQRRIFLKYSICSTTILATTSRATDMSPITHSLTEQGLKAVPALPSNGMIGVIAPSGPAANASEGVITWLNTRGYRAHLFPGTKEENGYLAGDDDRRLQDLHDAFSDKRIDAIICLRGGYGSARFLDRVDFNLIRANSKPFVGYSDITALHLAIAHYAGFVTFHGPMMISDLLRDKNEPTESSLFDMLKGRAMAGTWLPHPETYPLTIVNPGIARGKLIGGNLSTIGSTLGTPYEIQTQDVILFIEDVGEPLYRIDRLLTQLRLAGKYKNLRGVLVGDFETLTLDELMPLLKQEFTPLNIPVLAGWRSGHSNPNLTLPLGAMMILDASGQRIRVDQAVVKMR